MELCSNVGRQHFKLNSFHIGGVKSSLNNIVAFKSLKLAGETLMPIGSFDKDQHIISMKK